MEYVVDLWLLDYAGSWYACTDKRGYNRGHVEHGNRKKTGETCEKRGVAAEQLTANNAGKN